MGLGVVVDDDAGIEQAIGVQQRLDAPHQRHPLRPPFELHIGGHVATGAVLGLEGPAKAHRDQLGHRIHKGAIAGHLGRIIKALGKDEVQVPLQRVAKDDGFTVFEAIEQGLQPRHPFGQTLDGKGDILDDDGGAGGAYRPHRREEPLANGPEAGAVDSKRHRGDLGELGGHGRHLLAAIHQLFLRFPMHLDKQGAGRQVQRLDKVRQAGLARHRVKGSPIHQLHRRHRRTFQARGGQTGLLGIPKHQQGRGLVGVFGHGVEHHLGDKAEGPLRSDHQVGEDIDGVLMIEQGIDGVAGGVLEPVLVANFRGKLGVRQHLGAQGGEPREQLRAPGRQGGAAVGIAALQHGAIGQQQRHGVQGVVAVVGGAAAHAARVVGGDATQLAGVDGGRIRPNLAPQGRQIAVGIGADHPGLQGNARPLVQNAVAAPAVGQGDEHRIAQGLAREAGAGGAKGARQAQFAAHPQHEAHFIQRVEAHDALGHQAVEAGVRAVGQSQVRVAHQPLLRDAREHGGVKLVPAHQQSSTSTTKRRLGPWAP